jgi:hypothetical protein
MLSMVGCGGGGHYLRWNATPAASSMSGKLAIAVTDKREEKKGGLHQDEVGRQTGSFGIPQAIRLKKSDSVASSVRDLVAQAAAAAGIGVAAPGQEGSATAKLVIEVQTLWCTGYNPVYKADVTASVAVVDPATGAVRVPAQPLSASGGGMACQSIYKKLMSDIYQQAKTLLSQSPIKQASIGQVAQASAPPARLARRHAATSAAVPPSFSFDSWIRGPQ